MYLSSYDHKSLMSVSEWDAIVANYQAVMSSVTGFDWTKVVAIENRVAQNDWSVNDTFDPQRTETHKFMIQDQYGQLEHDYFLINETGGIQVVEAFNKASGVLEQCGAVGCRRHKLHRFIVVVIPIRASDQIYLGPG